LGSDHVVPDRILDQIGIALGVKRVHDPVFVKRHGPSRHIQNFANFFHRFSFGQQLQDFALPPVSGSPSCSSFSRCRRRKPTVSLERVGDS
jgi:hypothetical protein